MKQCQFCEQCFENVSQIANHVRWQHKRLRLQRKCKFCGRKCDVATILSHERSCSYMNYCAHCGRPTKNQKFCSKQCSTITNNVAGKTGYATFRRKHGLQKILTYRDICFSVWDKRCALCGWDTSIDVHHVDDNHKNNEIQNLIPLCQNHHMLTRMRDKREVIRPLLKEAIIRKFGLVAQSGERHDGIVEVIGS